MKEIKKLERRLHWSECFHLALMTLVLSFALTLTFQSDDRTTQILLALGTVIPVQLIRFLCERIERKSLRLLSSLAVMGLSILLTWSKERWSVYLLCCLPILISGVFLPRSKGRILLTIPSPWAVLALLVAYGYGRAVESLGVPMIANIVLVLTALATLNYFIHTSQSKLLTEICMTTETEISVSGMIRQNRKTLLVFLLIGVLILTAVPFLFRTESAEVPSTPWADETEQTGIPVDTIDPAAEKEYGRTGEGVPLHLELYKDILTWILIGIPSVGVLLSAVAGIRILLEMLAEKRKHSTPRNTDGLLIERLDEEETKKQKEKLTGWERKIRRRYEKLILHRTDEGDALKALTPTELERAAGLTGLTGTEELHDIYARTRYSPELPDRETYRRVKELARQLETGQNEKWRA